MDGVRLLSCIRPRVQPRSTKQPAKEIKQLQPRHSAMKWAVISALAMPFLPRYLIGLRCLLSALSAANFVRATSIGDTNGRVP